MANAEQISKAFIAFEESIGCSLKPTMPEKVQAVKCAIEAFEKTLGNDLTFGPKAIRSIDIKILAEKNNIGYQNTHDLVRFCMEFVRATQQD